VVGFTARIVRRPYQPHRLTRETQPLTRSDVQEIRIRLCGLQHQWNESYHCEPLYRDLETIYLRQKRVVWYVVATKTERPWYPQSTRRGIVSLFARSRSRNPRQWSRLSSDHAASHPGSTVVPCQGVDQCLSVGRVVDRFNLPSFVHAWRWNGHSR
jgi:hypothetical protein